MRLSTRCTTLILCGLLPSLLAAGPLPDSFSLGRYIPGDVWFYAHSVRNPERAWLEKEWQEVFDAFKATGIDRDITTLIRSMLSDTDPGQAQAPLDKWTKLINAMRWGDLIHEEVAFAERLGTIAPEYCLLARGKPGSAKANMANLVAIFKELAALSDEARLTNRELGDVTLWSLTKGDPASSEFPFSVELWRKGDVIGLATRDKLRDEIIALMRDKSEKHPIAATARFTEAIGMVPPPENGLMFFDAKAFLRNLGQMMEAVGAHGEIKGEGEKKNPKVFAAIKKAMTLFDVMEYLIVTVETQGRRTLSHEVTRLQQGKRKSALTRCWLDRKPFERFDRFIPADATGFSLSGLVNVEALYTLVTDFVRDELPEGAQNIAKWNGVLASIGFDPKRDLFSWWSGETISISLPPAVVTPMSKSDWVLMSRVKNSETASQKLATVLNFAREKAQTSGQMLMINATKIGPSEFHEVSHPLLMMAGLRPVIGVHGEWLMIGSSAATIKKCLDVAAGEIPSITANKRFKKEGLIPKGPVMSCSFKDTSKFGQEMAGAVSMMGMVGGIVTAQIPDEPGGFQAKQMVQKLMTMVMKLGPVLQKIDFYSSESSMCTYDGALTVRSEKVVTYKSPASDEAKTVDAN